MAIVKQGLCGNEGVVDATLVAEVQSPVYFFREGWFPSEPTFVPREEGAGEEDDGALLFTIMHGATREASLVVLDAKSMELMDEVALPTTMTFTTHGEFFRGMLRD